MKTLWFAGLILVSTATNVSAEKLPERRAGLWSAEYQVDGKARNPTVKCFDTKTELTLSKERQTLMKGIKGKCKKDVFTKDDSDYVLQTDCIVKDNHVETKTIYHGDFDLSYTATSFNKLTTGDKPPTESKSLIAFKYIGPCAPKAGKK